MSSSSSPFSNESVNIPKNVQTVGDSLQLINTINQEITNSQILCNCIVELLKIIERKTLNNEDIMDDLKSVEVLLKLAQDHARYMKNQLTQVKIGNEKK